MSSESCSASSQASALPTFAMAGLRAQILATSSVPRHRISIPMPDSVAIAILSVLAAYCAVGLCFAIAFILRGAASIDPVAAHAPIGFRLILIPGAAALWPWLLRRWIRQRKAENP